MPNLQNIQFIDNDAINTNSQAYLEVRVDTSLVIKSWKLSLYSFEWLESDGRIKAHGNLPFREQERRNQVEEALAKGQTIGKPVLGIGLMDNIEIGAGKAEFLTLAAHGVQEIPVHILKSCESDFKPFIRHIK